MTIRTRSKKWAVVIGVTILGIVASVLFYRPLMFQISVARLKIPIPPGSGITTSVYRDIPFFSTHIVWDRYYRIPEHSFGSADAVQQYFDGWITGYGWVPNTHDRIDDTSRCSFSSLKREDIERSLLLVYRPRWDYQSYICLVVAPLPDAGSYEVWLVTLNSTSVSLLNE